MSNLIEVRLKNCEGTDYLIPVELVEEFDQLESFICDGANEETDEYPMICQEFDDKFSKYNLEGFLSSTALFVAKEIFE
jgi:hypothetical protein